MSGSVYGRSFQISTWGESHGRALGVVIDGCPAGLCLDEQDVQRYLDRRRPGRSAISTPRREADEVEILSGVFEGRTTGTPICLIVRNTSQNPRDYSELAACYRPGHADYTFDEKYGFRDYRGGGRSSGRETIGRVAAGAVAAKVLGCLGIHVTAYTRAIGPVAADMDKFDAAAALETVTCMPDREASARAERYLAECMEQHDSAGGVIECRVEGLPAGIGDPVFEKLDANLAKAVMSIGAVKAFEMGDGLAASRARGSENNDAFRMRDGRVVKATNHSGGTLGGVSDGGALVFRAYVKPTPSIFREQETVDKEGREINLRIKGRHDPVIVPRAVVVVESMAAVTILDAMIGNMSARMDYLERVYRKQKR